MSDDEKKDKRDDVQFICNSKFWPREPFPEAMLREAEQESTPQARMADSGHTQQPTVTPPANSDESD